MNTAEDRRDETSLILEIILDEASIGRNTPEVEHERQVAIFDILEANLLRSTTARRTVPAEAGDRGKAPGVRCVQRDAGVPLTTFVLSLSPFSKLIKDYFFVCESYYEAIKTAPPSRIEALDMGRRGLHDEGSQLLIERLKGKITTDFDTARRLFTLICALHWKG